MLDSARAILVELSDERLLSVDGGWRPMWEDSWEAQRTAEIIMGLVTSLRIVHDHYSSDDPASGQLRPGALRTCCQPWSQRRGPRP